MAFFGKLGNILRQTASKKISSELSASKPSFFQAIRCMSSSKLFIGGASSFSSHYLLSSIVLFYIEVPDFWCLQVYHIAQMTQVLEKHSMLMGKSLRVCINFWNVFPATMCHKMLHSEFHVPNWRKEFGSFF